MTEPPAPEQQLFTGPMPVSMGDRGGPVRPGQVLLFSTEDGALVELPRKPTALGSLRYRFRYEVDLVDRTVGWSEPLPSGTGGFPFQASFEARWRVTDATEVVRRGIRSVAEGHSAVCVAMRDLLWPHAASYGIERLQEFADYVRTSVCDRSHRLPVGLTVDTLVVRLYLDSHASDHLRALKQREFDTQIAAAERDVALTTQSVEAELQAKREEVLLSAARGEGGLLLHLIAQDPSKLHEIMSELGNRHDVAVEQKAQMLRDLVGAGMIQPAEAQHLWHEMQRPAPLFDTGTGGTAALPAPAAGASQAPAPLPPGAGRATAGQAGPTAGTRPAVQGTQPTQHAVVAGMVVPPTGPTPPPRPRRRPGSASSAASPAGEPPTVPPQVTPAAAGPGGAPGTAQNGPVRGGAASPGSSAETSPPGDGSGGDAAASGGSANVTGATRVGRRRSGGSGGPGTAS
ncbi:hypothetical protein AB0903_05720 [Streptomyces sp. NPDC048389]|uniref:hypothetical protein n=1 Tax=Streptomyces sp. NPDC048389 TaxID=3154622 RepID=UPI003454F4E5